MTEETLKKSKEFALTLVNIQEQTNKSIVDAISKFAGHDFTTYAYGFNFINTEMTKYARKTIEELSSFPYARNKG